MGNQLQREKIEKVVLYLGMFLFAFAFGPQLYCPCDVTVICVDPDNTAVITGKSLFKWILDEQYIRCEGSRWPLMCFCVRLSYVLCSNPKFASDSWELVTQYKTAMMSFTGVQLGEEMSSEIQRDALGNLPEVGSNR